jgi:hypothetical protein
MERLFPNGCSLSMARLVSTVALLLVLGGATGARAEEEG